MNQNVAERKIAIYLNPTIGEPPNEAPLGFDHPDVIAFKTRYGIDDIHQGNIDRLLYFLIPDNGKIDEMSNSPVVDIAHSVTR